MHYEPAFVTQAWLSALNLAGILGSTVHLMQVFALDGVSPLRSGRWQFHKLATLKRLSGTAARASRCDRHFPLRCRLRCISAALKSCSVSHGLTSSLRSAKCTEILGHPGHRRLDHACGGLVPFRFAGSTSMQVFSIGTSSARHRRRAAAAVLRPSPLDAVGARRSGLQLGAAASDFLWRETLHRCPARPSLLGDPPAHGTVPFRCRRFRRVERSHREGRLVHFSGVL